MGTHCEDSIIPDGVEIQHRETTGHGLYATRKFLRGEWMYNAVCKYIPDIPGPFVLRTQFGNYDMDVVKHTVLSIRSLTSHKNMREMFGFEGFMNHSCDPSIYNPSSSVKFTEDGYSYDVVARRDIKAGEELNTDYDNYEWNSEDKKIDPCLCGSYNCRGSSLGFQFLSEIEQCRHLAKVDTPLREQWLHEHPDVMFRDLVIPDGVRIARSTKEFRIQGTTTNDQSLKVVTTRSFQKGERLYEYNATMFDPAIVKQILVSYPNPDINTKLPHMFPEAEPETSELDFIWHTINRGKVREFNYFGSFINHSCNPNMRSVYTDATHQYAVALRNIAEGEEIFYDYEDSESILDGTEFNCECGFQFCRKTIHG